MGDWSEDRVQGGNKAAGHLTEDATISACIYLQVGNWTSSQGEIESLYATSVLRVCRGLATPHFQRYPDHVRLFGDGLECAGVRYNDRLLASRHQRLLPRNSTQGHFQHPQRRSRHFRGRSTQ